MWSEELENRLHGKNVASSVIIYGQARERYAKELAKAYLCEGQKTPCGVCLHCLKVEKDIHPDVIVIGEDGASLKVSTVREMRADAYVHPNEAKRKIYIITRAETLNASAQNALLKLLEEGPSFAVFFFLLPNPEQLLDTIQSRSEAVYCFEDSSHEPSQLAMDIVDALKEDTNPLELLPMLVLLEKKKRDEFIVLLDDIIQILVERVKENPELYLPKLEVFQTLRANAEYNLGVGHMVGFLIAKLV